MAKPSNKKELLAQSETNFKALFAYIDTLSSATKHQAFSQTSLNRNIRDVLCHLHQWHLFLLTWHQVGQAGGKPAMPAEGHTWQTLPKLNREIHKKYAKTSLKKSIEMVNHSHEEVINLIKKHTNTELFTKKKYVWTGSTSLGVYCISNVCSHYAWGLKLIKKGLK